MKENSFKILTIFIVPKMSIMIEFISPKLCSENNGGLEKLVIEKDEAKSLFYTSAHALFDMEFPFAVFSNRDTLLNL